MNLTNHQFRLAARPVGMPKRTDWTYSEQRAPEPNEGELLVKVLYISLDPAMRGWMNDGKSYVPPVGLGEVMRALAVGRVIASKHPKFATGDFVSGSFGIQEYAVSDGKGVAKVDTRIAPLPLHLSALGMPGMTAYFGLLDIGQPKPGDTVVVSAASGAVGSVVGQLAKLARCRVVGVAGGKEKCDYVVKELGFDACIDHRGDDLKRALAEATPQGVDVYFENVGGPILDLVLARCNPFARIPLCGMVSQYNATDPYGVKKLIAAGGMRIKLQGSIVSDHMNRRPEEL